MLRTAPFCKQVAKYENLKVESWLRILEWWGLTFSLHGLKFRFNFDQFYTVPKPYQPQFALNSKIGRSNHYIRIDFYRQSSFSVIDFTEIEHICFVIFYVFKGLEVDFL